MTSEVALLNKSCVALAADSATTVSYWEKGEQKTRYFKGANKIFNLSGVHPVGLMTYASANLEGVPWEIIAKAYRQYAKSNGHAELSGYAQDFFEFIATNAHIFPAATQQKQFKALADRAAAKIVYPVLRHTNFKDEKDPALKRTAYTTLFDAQKDRVIASELVPGGTQVDADSAVTRFAGEVQAAIEADSWYSEVPRDATAELARIAIVGIYKEDFTGLQYTGLAFAGYGDREYFPRMEVHRCSGMVLGKLLCARESEVEISQECASELIPLAMSEMIGTFTWGISDSGLNQLWGCFRERASELVDALRVAGHLPAGLDAAPFIDTVAKKHIEKMMGYFADSHQVPLRRVIASLPYSEMAELAETLVFMESMKERVTAPSESVSGPIDVAVISKGDGFVWVKRKHYFDPKLNPRFFRRHSATE